MASEYSMLLSLIHNAFKPLHNPPANAAAAYSSGQQVGFYYDFFRKNLWSYHNYFDLIVELDREYKSSGVPVRCLNFYNFLEYLDGDIPLSYISVSDLSESNIQNFIEGDFQSDFILKGVNLGFTYIKINYTGDEPWIKVTLTDHQKQKLFLNIWNDLI